MLSSIFGLSVDSSIHRFAMLVRPANVWLIDEFRISQVPLELGELSKLLNELINLYVVRLQNGLYPLGLSKAERLRKGAWRCVLELRFRKYKSFVIRSYFAAPKCRAIRLMERLGQ